MLTSGRLSTPASCCPQNRPNECCKFPPLQGPLSFHTLLLEGSHFLCFQRDVFQASCVGAQATAACRSPTPVVIPGGKGEGKNVQDGGAKEEASPLIFWKQAWGGGQGRALGVSSRSSKGTSLGLFTAQDPHRIRQAGGGHQKRSCSFVAHTQAGLLTRLFLPPPRLASDQIPSALEPEWVSRTWNVVCEQCTIKRALDLQRGT